MPGSETSFCRRKKYAGHQLLRDNQHPLGGVTLPPTWDSESVRHLALLPNSVCFPSRHIQTPARYPLV